MITVTIFQDHADPVGFHCIGHSGYAAAGSDIICAGVSALVINTVNSIATYTEARYSLDTEEKTGRIDFSLESAPDHDTSLLLNAMVLGLQGIQRDYGSSYLALDFKEV